VTMENSSRFQEKNKFKCPYQDCFFVTDTAKKLRKHKRVTEEHDYCSKCDLDFEDWDSLTAHKVATNCHVTCKHCGQDFVTTGARNNHIKAVSATFPYLLVIELTPNEQRHPIEQEIPCVGCNSVFAKASALVAHFERGDCPIITRYQFLGYLQHKNLVAKLLQNPELIKRIKFTDWDAVVNDTEIQGGVPLKSITQESKHNPPNTHSDIAKHSNLATSTPSLPERNDADIGTVASKSEIISNRQWQNNSHSKFDTNWPNLPTAPSAKLPCSTAHNYSKQATHLISMGTQIPKFETINPQQGINNEGNKNYPIGELTRSNIEGQGNGLQSNSSRFTSSAIKRTPASKPRVWGNTEVQEYAPKPFASIKAEQEKEKTAVWGAATTKKLFPDAKQTNINSQSSSIGHDWEAAVEQKNTHEEAQKDKNIMTARLWDPASREYNPRLFYDPFLEAYHCPFPVCGETFKIPKSLPVYGERFRAPRFPERPREEASHAFTQHELELHLNSAHREVDCRCPNCLKIFKSVSALIAHCEAVGSRCGISTTNKFAQVIDAFSGGFVAAKTKVRPDFVDDPANTITYTKYDSAKPATYEEKPKEITIGHKD